MKAVQTRCVTESVSLVSDDIDSIVGIIDKKQSHPIVKLIGLLNGLDEDEALRSSLAAHFERIRNNAKYAIEKLGFDPDGNSAWETATGKRKSKEDQE